MKKIILLCSVLVLANGCSLWYMDHRNCTYVEEDGLYYDWRDLPEKKYLVLV